MNSYLNHSNYFVMNGGPRKSYPLRTVGLELLALPYDTSACSFYFRTLDEYSEKFAAFKKRSSVEEYEIDFMDGSAIEQALFREMRVSQGSLGAFFDALELDQDEQLGMIALMETLGMDAENAREAASDVQLFEGTGEDYVQQLLDDTGLSDALAEQYFDYQAWGRDVRLEGNITNALEEDIEMYERQGDEEEAQNLREEVERIDRLTDQELAFDIVESIGSLKDAVSANILVRYFDYSSFARDMEINGELATVEIGGTSLVFTNPSDF